MSDKDYKKLQQKWYNELARRGFDDIEWSEGQDSRYLKRRITPTPSQYQERTDYYRLVDSYLHDRNLKGKDRFIWKRHSKGMPVTEIQQAFEHVYKEKISQYTIRDWINRLWKSCKKWNTQHPLGCLYKSKEEESD